MNRAISVAVAFGVDIADGVEEEDDDEANKEHCVGRDGLCSVDALRFMYLPVEEVEALATLVPGRVDVVEAAVEGDVTPGVAPIGHTTVDDCGRVSVLVVVPLLPW